MKKYLKGCIAAIFALVITLSFCGCGTDDELPQPTKEFFINDFADVITGEDEKTIYSQGVALQEKTKAQTVVVTVKSLDGEPIEEYALEIGREWGVGDEGKDNGIVILLSQEDRQIYIAVGYGLEGALPDSKTGRIIDTYAIPHLSANDFSSGITSVYNAVVNEIYIEYGLEPAANYTPADYLPELTVETASAGEVIISWIALIGIVAVYMLVFGRRGGLFVFGAPRFFGGGFHFHGSGFGGGSSFGGFKGGGGSFGGGGAGRKF